MQSKHEAVFVQLIEEVVRDLAKALEEKHGLSVEDTMLLWHGGPQDDEGVAHESSRNTSPTEKKCCPYEYLRGVKKGTRCGACVRKNDAAYCSKHRGTAKKAPKKEPGVVFRRHTQFRNFLWHAETGFILQTRKGGVVGKIVESEEGECDVVMELTELEKEKCKDLNLPLAPPGEPNV